MQTIMFRRKLLTVAVVVSIAAIAAGCGSSSKSSTKSGGKTITIGVLTDVTGISSSSNKTTVQGVQAGIAQAKKEGYTIKYVVADTTSSLAGTLSAAQSLIEQHHVTAVIASSSFTFVAAKYLTQQHIPVIGSAEDGTEWGTSSNMFSVYGAVNPSKVATTFGKFLQLKGVTSLGSVGYGISPSSAEAAKGYTKSAAHFGIKTGYLNADFTFGSTNVEPEVLAMKSAHVNGFSASLEANSELAIISGLRQQGVNLKAAILATGYGGDTLNAGQATIQQSQGVYFFESFEPIEMHTAATKQFASALADIGIKEDPTYGEYVGYASVAMLVQALQSTGASPTSASLLTALKGIKSFNAWGLLGSKNTFEPSDKAAQVIGTPCVYYTRLEGTKFNLVSGADPICGTLIPGVTVSAAS